MFRIHAQRPRIRGTTTNSNAVIIDAVAAAAATVVQRSGEGGEREMKGWKSYGKDRHGECEVG